MRTTPWCVMPWTYLEILTTGDVTPCCASYYLYGNVKDKSVEQIWNDEPIKKLRLEMFNDELPEACNVCKEIENTGSECSLRIANNEKLKSTTDEDGFTSPEGFQLTMNYNQVTPYHGVVIKHLLNEVNDLKKEIDARI